MFQPCAQNEAPKTIHKIQETTPEHYVLYFILWLSGICPSFPYTKQNQTKHTPCTKLKHTPLYPAQSRVWPWSYSASFPYTGYDKFTDYFLLCTNIKLHLIYSQNYVFVGMTSSSF